MKQSERLRRAKISKTLRAHYRRKREVSARRSESLRRYWRTVKRIHSRNVKAATIEGRTGTRAARLVYTLAKRTGSTYRDAFETLSGAPLVLPPAPIIPAIPSGRIILQGDISWTGLFSFLPGESLPIPPKAGPDDPLLLSNMPDDISRTIKDEAAGLKSEAEGISGTKGGLIRGEGSDARAGRGEVVGRYGPASTAPSWFRKIARSKADVIANLNRIVVNDPKNDLARKLIQLIAEMQSYGRFEGGYEVRPGDEEFLGYWQAYLAGQYGQGSEEFLEPGMLNIKALSWDAAGVQKDSAFDREALRDIRAELDETLSIETGEDAKYNVWRVYDLFHYEVTDPGSGGLLISVFDGSMLADWDTIAGEFK